MHPLTRNHAPKQARSLNPQDMLGIAQTIKNVLVQLHTGMWLGRLMEGTWKADCCYLKDIAYLDIWPESGTTAQQTTDFWLNHNGLFEHRHDFAPH